MAVMAPPLVLIGFMGCGKTTVGRRLAAALGLAFLDLDDLIALSAGRSPAELIRDRGEVAFRRLETSALAWALDTRDTVVATGGGALGSAKNRGALAGCGGEVVWLEVEPEEALQRCGGFPAGDGGGSLAGGAGRPLLPATEKAARALMAARAPGYSSVATVRVDTSGRSPDEVVGILLKALGKAGTGDGSSPGAPRIANGSPPEAIRLDGGPPGHGPVWVGHDLLPRLDGLAGFPEGVTGPVVLVADPLALALHGSAVAASLARTGRPVVTHVLPRGERAKTPASLARIWGSMARGGLERGGLVVTLGGGVATDAGGLAAATFMRGVRVVHLPTTLLAQVDASIGGKTAVNLPAGKNLAGTFYQPSLVVADVGACHTLGPGFLAEGLVELFKTLLVSGEPVDELRADLAGPGGVGESGEPPAGGAGVHTPPSGLLSDLVRRAAAAKLAVTRLDPLDRGPRLALNLGHTFGHALEAASGYRSLRHGLAVGVGLLAAVRVSRELGLLSGDGADGVMGLASELLSLFPAAVRGPLSRARAGEALARAAWDKKRTDRRTVYVLLRRKQGGLESLATSDVPETLARESLEWALAQSLEAVGRPVRREWGSRDGR